MELKLNPGSITANFSMHELGGVVGGDPKVLSNKQAMHLHYNFNQNGPFFGVAWPPNTYQWEVNVMFEVYGPLEGPANYVTVIPFVNGAPHIYSGALTIPHTNLPDDCVCRIVAQLTLKTYGGASIMGTGFDDLGMWQFTS